MGGAEVRAVEEVGVAIRHGQVTGRRRHGLHETEEIPVPDDMIQQALFQQRVTPASHPVLLRPGGDPAREIFRQHPTNRFPKMPAHQLGGFIVARIKSGQPGKQVIAVLLLEALGQAGLPGQELGAALVLARLEPKRHQVRLVGVEGRHLSMERAEPTRVLLMRQRDKFFHGRGIEQVRVTARGLKTFLGRFRLGPFADDLKGKGRQPPWALQAGGFDPTGLDRNGRSFFQNGPPVLHRIKVRIDKFFRFGW